VALQASAEEVIAWIGGRFQKISRKDREDREARQALAAEIKRSNPFKNLKYSSV
jgi:hypothetical protein